MLLTILVTLSFLTHQSHAKDCPEPYRSFDRRHSYCLSPNRKYNILHSGLSEAEEDVIVNAHNEYRNKIASGEENGLPSAADMNELVWDEELASIAQGWANNCVFQHDRDSARKVERYDVGQNLFMQGTTRSPSDNYGQVLKSAITEWYNEVRDFNRRSVSNFQSNSRKMIGHFTQVVWASSTEIGCGFTVFKDGRFTKSFLVCNYGPAGNILGHALYEQGGSCSACPSGSTCDSYYTALCSHH